MCAPSKEQFLLVSPGGGQPPLATLLGLKNSQFIFAALAFIIGNYDVGSAPLSRRIPCYC